MENPKKIAILGGSRIPFCRSLGKYKELGNIQMLTAAIKGIVDKFNLENKIIDELASGAVVKRSKDFSLAREGLLAAKLHPNSGAFDVGKACGTSLEAAILLGNKIALGQIDSAIASGVDSSSDVPIELSENLSRRLAQMSRARTMMDKVKLMSELSFGDVIPKLPGVKENRTGLTMGQHCELMAQEWKLSREEQDQLAVESHQKAAAAWERGFYSDLVTEFNGASKDDNIRPDSSMDKMKKLRPCFEKSDRGTLTAANSTPLTDGAAAVLLSSEEWASEHNIKPMAYLTHAQGAAVNYEGEEGLLMAPAYAVSKMLKKAGLTFDDIDFFEVHEAFAAQAICTFKAWESDEFCREKLGLPGALGSIDRNKLNLAGGSVALGHPFAATGARILAGAAKLLEEKGSGRCLSPVCTAGGMGVAAIIER